MLYPAELRARGRGDIGARVEARNPSGRGPIASRCVRSRAALHQRPMRAFAPLLALGLIGCAASSATEPSLARRPAEAIDPRLPIASEPTLGPVDAALANRLSQLVAEGQAGAQTFEAQVGPARALAEAAGPAQSEGWIIAQQALSGLEGARAGSTRALSDIDAIVATRIQSGAGLTAADRGAVEAASGELRALTDRQSSIIDQLAARLGR